MKHRVGVVVLALSLVGAFAAVGSYFHELSGAASYDVTGWSGASREGGGASAQAGQRLFDGRGGCLACHGIGDHGVGVRGPNLGVLPPDFTEPVAVRAASAEDGVTAVEHLVEALYAPDAYVTPGFEAGVMNPIDGPPTMLSDEEIRSILLFLFQRSGVPATDELEREIAEAQRAFAAEPAGGDAAEPAADAGGDADRGRARFAALACGGCHGPEGGESGAAAPPELAGGREPVELLLRIARHPRPEAEGEAATWGAALTVRDGEDIAAFLVRAAAGAP